jgi:diphosphomevalonate decarboxylase
MRVSEWRLLRSAFEHALHCGELGHAVLQKLSLDHAEETLHNCINTMIFTHFTPHPPLLSRLQARPSSSPFISTMADTHTASTTAPVNIAVIKNWGKRDPKLNLPTNSSLSVTLSQSDLRTHTTASCSSSYPKEDSLLLNGSPQDVSGARTQACFRELRALRKQLEDEKPDEPKLAHLPLKIVSENNFPTAAGLASSAAGFAALVRAIANLYQLPSSPTDLSRIARQGSGSACRSLFGGYVGWEQGSLNDGSDSVAFQVASASHWPSMRALILVVSAAKKGVSSTTGMQTTVATSSLFASRASETVPRRMKEMIKAIEQKDFETFGKVTMMDSNSFHATCLDTYPPIFYLNDVSRAAIKVVESINTAAGKIIAAYTFDAGPNAVIYYLEENEKQVAGLFKEALGEKDGWAGERGQKLEGNKEALAKAQEDANVALDLLKEGVSRVILTGVGEGPVRTEKSLINEKGEPV